MRLIDMDKLKEDIKEVIDCYVKCHISDRALTALYESGMNIESSGCNSWARNEEMVDWLAIRSPKTFKAFREAGCGEEF